MQLKFKYAIMRLRNGPHEYMMMANNYMLTHGSRGPNNIKAEVENVFNLAKHCACVQWDFMNRGI